MATHHPIPDPPDPYEEAGLPATDDALPGKLITGDVQDDVVVPTDHPTYVNAYGTTDLEAELGEPLGQRLSHEEPDVLSQLDKPWTDPGDVPDDVANPFPEDPDERAGRLVAPDEGAHPDEEADLYADDVGTDLGGFSPEERAMHIEPDSGS
ncbi:MAG: hypothetical protein QOJ11_3968 [Frankiales bacterium]|jgi:hypothetical protein|nr:hypothetical protein [Frankiales bacterium]